MFWKRELAQMGIIFDNPQDRPQPPRPQRRRLIEEEERAPPLKRGPQRGKQAVADPVVLTLFVGLQKLWRRQGTLRRTYGGMRASPDEAELWQQLARYLTKQDNWA
jgi:hypothetical protein